MAYVGLPKVELHAHLHGCIRPATLAALLPPTAAAAATVPAATHPGPTAARSLSDCFATFAAIHAAVTTSGAVARVVTEALTDATVDGVWCVRGCVRVGRGQRVGPVCA
jgi:adenosine deaminase